jgi:hypothetical protein
MADGLARTPWIPQPHRRRRRARKQALVSVPSVHAAIREDDEGFAARERMVLAQRFDAATRALARSARRSPHRDRVFIALAGIVPGVRQSRQRLSSRQFSGLPIASPRKPERYGRLVW